MYLATNTNKRGLTLDLSSPEGRELFFGLVARSDILVENFSPRVFDNFAHHVGGRQRAEPPNSDGPHAGVRPRRAMAQQRGFRANDGTDDRNGVGDRPRVRPAADPPRPLRPPGRNALRVRHAGRRSGNATRRAKGLFIEVSMVESALNAAAEQVVEFTAYGNLISRLGNRSRDAAPQGLYRCAGTERWLALSVATDEQWRLLKSALGEPDWANDPALDTHDGRARAHDVIDKHLEQWAGRRDSSAAAELLIEYGVPAADLADARVGSMHPQLAARGFFESLDHPIAGPHHVPAIPFKYRSVDKWYRKSAPTLGQHNAERPRRPARPRQPSIAALAEKGVIGTRPGGLD